jgi:hypothetical protein
MAELEARGMRRTAVSVLEKAFSARFTGWVALSAKSIAGPGEPAAVLVTPRVGIRDEEVSRLVAELRGLAPDDPEAPGHSLVIKDLSSLLPRRGSQPQEWTARSEAEADRAARRIADDIDSAAIPYLVGKSWPEAYYEELTEQVWRLLWPHEAAVAHMLRGDAEEAKRMLLTIARPLSQQPTTWAEQDAAAAAFFRAFAARFCVDLRIGDWPVKGD